jgi:hypothetical protein
MMHEKNIESLWFAISPADSEATGVDMNDFPRFNRLVSNHRQKYQIDTCFPRLVSFVGTTGAGKSTIIRLMLEKPWLADSGSIDDFDLVPIVGDSEATVPTSGDVHLFAEATTRPENVDRPLFFVDCEGFEGGALDPAGSLAYQRQQTNSNPLSIVQQWFRYAKGKTRTLKLSAFGSDSKKVPKRGKVVRELFPKLLYNFSDVVVFVVGEQNTIADRIHEILDWASTSSSSALERATQPRLIIVINRADVQNWNSQARRKRFFEEHEADMKDSRIKDIQSRINEKIADCSRVETLENLFLVHYAEVDIVHIPHEHVRSRLAEQLRDLDQTIEDRTKESQERKGEVGMLLQSQEQQQFFQLAFDHFFHNWHTKKPFNFLETLLKLRPIPHTVSSNIAQLFEDIFETGVEQGISWNATGFLRTAAPVVCSAIALSLARSPIRIPGTLVDLFDGGSSSSEQLKTYAKQVKQALEKFSEQRKCEFVSYMRKCTIRQKVHEDGKHYDDKSELLGQSAFESEFLNGEDGIWSIWEHEFRTAMGNVQISAVGPNRSAHLASSRVGLMHTTLRLREETAWKVHHDRLLGLNRGLSRLDRKTTKQLFICYFCLHEIPFMRLQCDHSICEELCESFSTISRDCLEK